MKYKSLVLFLIAFIIIFSGCDINKKPETNISKPLEPSFKEENSEDIYNIEWFKLQYNGYVNTKNQIEIAEKKVQDYVVLTGKDKTKWPKEFWDSYYRLTTNVEGLKIQLERIKSNYNSKAQILNKNIFSENGIPFEITD